MLEFADDQFHYLRKQIDNIRDEYRVELQATEGKVPVDAESIRVFLEESEKLESIFNNLDNRKFSIAPIHPSSASPFGKLILTLTIARITDLTELKRKISAKSDSEWENEFSTLFEKWKTAGYRDFLPRPGPPKLVLDTPNILRLVVYLISPDALQKKILTQVPFGDRLQEALKAASAARM